LNGDWAAVARTLMCDPADVRLSRHKALGLVATGDDRIAIPPL
jgi:hypothetical protein